MHDCATHVGIARTASWPWARYAVGVSPTISVKLELKDPSEVQPTDMQASVTFTPARINAMARSILRVIR